METLTIKTNPQLTAADTHEPERRRIKGLVLPWGKIGNSSSGRVVASRGKITIPADLGRVKLLRDHSDNPHGFQPVGYAVKAEERDDGLYMEFSVGEGPDGDQALKDVQGRVRDALSVELIDVHMEGQNITAAQLTAVALVPIPAFEDARVSEVKASLDVNNGMSAIANRLKAAAGTVSECADQLNPAIEKDNPAMDTKPSPATDKTNAARVSELLTCNRSKPEPLTFAKAMDVMRMVRNHEPLDDSLTAALQDITRSANPAISAPQWLGELWSGVGFQREIVPLMTQGTLTRMKAVGFRWTKKPKVQDYAGDKAEIPSSPVATEAVETVAKRLATGNDIDRAYYDFNESEFIEAYMRACAESYAMVTDEKAAAFIKTSAAGNKKPAEPNLLHAAGKARQVIKAGTRVEPSAFLVHSDDMFELLKITTMDNPAYLDLIGVDPKKFIASDQAKKGSVIAWAKPAVTFYELPGSPIRVIAEDIARGGRDSAVFGYWATLLNNQAGVVEVPITPAPGPAA
ncbi:hypothetical protein GP475_09670 [Corynebacterium poyangense]|uniref:Uncharacterized protein n=1 Tax=Corynebacterium poyangense TaxID=2684405 RepID=A0A7H0SQQ2_9CORY|nr:hypothetical protein [Corynebacterium poyangense]QNQ90877.1 hypothetical protein GP475_09670 [Corynebacterium poyangense]